MLVHVNGKGFELSSELQLEVGERVEFALDRFSSRIAKVNAFLEDVNGPKNGHDKSLRLVIDVEHLPLIVIEEKGEVWRALIDSVVERAAHAVSRQVERLRSKSNQVSMAGNRDQD